MHNWWIAAFEEAGIWTSEQAQHISDHIKTTIHRDNYTHAADELRSILSRGEFGIPAIKQVEAKLSALESKVLILTQQLEAASAQKEVKVDKTPKA